MRGDHSRVLRDFEVAVIDAACVVVGDVADMVAVDAVGPGLDLGG